MFLEFMDLRFIKKGDLNMKKKMKIQFTTLTMRRKLKISNLFN